MTASVLTVTADQFIGDRVHNELRLAGRSAKALAEVLDIDASSISLKIKGKRPWRAGEVIATARFLGVPSSYLLPDERDVVEPPDRIELSTYALLVPRDGAKTDLSVTVRHRRRTDRVGHRVRENLTDRDCLATAS